MLAYYHAEHLNLLHFFFLSFFLFKRKISYARKIYKGAFEEKTDTNIDFV